MNVQDIQFQPGDSDEVRLKKLRALVEELIRMSRTTAGGSSSGGSAADVSAAPALLYQLSNLFPNGLRLAAGDSIDFAQVGQTLLVSLNSVPISKITQIPSGYVLGRYDGGTGEVQLIQIGEGLTLDGSVLKADAAESAGYPPQLGHAGI